MFVIPKIDLTLLNGFLLMIPLFILRFGVPRYINTASIDKLQYFPEIINKEKIALWVYFITNTYIIFSPLLYPIYFNAVTTTVGIIIYIIGCIILTLSIINFSREEGFIEKGVYRISRNPMYIGYFGIFLGTAFMINSILHIIIIVIYQIAVHFLIVSEERWCQKQFGEEYRRYCNEVPRYIFFF